MKPNDDPLDVEQDRAVSPVIGVILMVAITVILAAVIGTFVLQLGQKTGDTAPQLSASYSDADDPFTSTKDGDNSRTNLFKISLNSLSPNVDATDLELRIRNPETGNIVATFIGQDLTFTDSSSDLHLRVNAGTLASGDKVKTGDVLVVYEDTSTTGTVTDSTEYTIEFRYIGGDSPKIISSTTVELS